MTSINITELRQHLPEYLKQVQAGEEVVITVHGKAIARIVPDRQESERDAALKRLDALRSTEIQMSGVSFHALTNKKEGARSMNIVIY